MLDRIALALTIIGAINWGSIGIFQFDIVAWMFGGQGALVSRIVYTLVALAGMVLVSGVFEGGFSGDNRYGILLALGAAVLYAAIIICNKRMGPMSSFDRVASQLLF